MAGAFSRGGTSPSSEDSSSEKHVDTSSPSTTRVEGIPKPRRRPLPLDFDRQGHRLFPEVESAPNDSGSANRYRAAYRNLPIFSGIMIPFSIMLSIPSLTGHWYIRTGSDNELLEIRPNPLLLDLAMGFSMACGVLANICIVVRFSERRIKLMTALCIMFLSLHDIINIPAVTIFGVLHRVDDGFTYGQSFWLTLCSTLFSTATNVTLIFDYLNTRDFTHSGSGLTSKQRSLVISLIILLCYISLGSLLLAVTLKISFLDALYLAVVSIETIGFGDLHPTTTGTRVLACVYISGGILNLALLVTLSREALLEAAAETVQQRLQAARTHARERNIRARWRAAIHWRLQAKGLHTWIDDRAEERFRHFAHSRRRRHWYTPIQRAWLSLVAEVWREWEDPAWKYVYGHRHKRLNLEPLSEAELETAALEAGLPLSELIPKGLKLRGDDESTENSSTREDAPFTNWQNPGVNHPSLTHVRMVGMISLLHNFAFAFSNGLSGLEQESFEQSDGEDTAVENGRPHSVPFARSLTTTMTLSDDDYNRIYIPESLETVERNAFYTRLTLALSLFFIFWMAGSAIFMKTEGWGFGSAMYFCFISFTTVGYGDLSPKTPAGRSIFIVWALLGVGTMTILVSILAEGYSKSYKSVIKTENVTSMDLLSETIPPTSSQQRLFDPRDMTPPAGSNLIPDRNLIADSEDSRSSVLSSPTIAGPGQRLPRSHLSTVIFPIPEATVYPVESTPPDFSSLKALPSQVLRHVDRLTSLIEMQMASRNNSSVAIEASGQGEETFDEARMRGLLEIEEHLAQLSNTAKDALKDDASASVTFSL